MKPALCRGVNRRSRTVRSTIRIGRLAALRTLFRSLVNTFEFIVAGFQFIVDCN